MFPVLSNTKKESSFRAIHMLMMMASITREAKSAKQPKIYCLVQKMGPITFADHSLIARSRMAHSYP